MLAAVKRLVRKFGSGPDLSQATCRALGWLREHECPGGGIAVGHLSPLVPYPEVTGYLIPTLMTWGEHELAARCARWLVSCQNPDGSWSDSSGTAAYVFDTGQILKGLLAIHRRLPEVEEAIHRGCSWMTGRIQPDGRLITPFTGGWIIRRGGIGLALLRRMPRVAAMLRSVRTVLRGNASPDIGHENTIPLNSPGVSQVPEAIHLYAIKPLLDAAALFGEPSFAEAAARATAYYAAQPALTDPDTLSHFHAYILEGLLDLGRRDLMEPAMAGVARRQRPNGSVPAYPDVTWVCTPAVAQYAVIWYRLGDVARGWPAVRYLSKKQATNGGFPGGIGLSATYFPGEHISWAVKFFLDAVAWHLRTAFNEEAHVFPSDVDRHDGRLQAVLEALGDVSGKRILDAGCGKGRFAAAIHAAYPSALLSGIDLSDAMVAQTPAFLDAVQGSILDLPYADGEFDAVYCIETLEHAVNPSAAVAELCRVTKPGGTVVIVDKNRDLEGTLRLEPWEQWFRREEVEGWLNTHCSGVTSRLIGYGEKSEADGLFLAWVGTRG